MSTTAVPDAPIDPANVLPGASREYVSALADQLLDLSGQLRTLALCLRLRLAVPPRQAEALRAALAPAGYELLHLAGRAPSLPVVADPRTLLNGVTHADHR